MRAEHPVYGTAAYTAMTWAGTGSFGNSSHNVSGLQIMTRATDTSFCK